MWDKLKSIDAYPKLATDIRVRTLSGGAISIMMLTLISVLFLLELSAYLRVETTDELRVDDGFGPGKLPITFDVTFPHIPCSLLSVDAMDVSGEHQYDISHNIHKRPIDKNGIPIGQVLKNELGATAGAIIAKSKSEESSATPAPTTTPGLCMSCYGAEEHPGACCNTCEDVRRAYRGKGWALEDLKNIEQCARVGETNERFQAELSRGDGCQIYGELEVHKLSGNFHFAPGKSFENSAVHMHDLVAFSSSTFNITHHINRIRFGDTYPGAVQPLDDRHAVATEGGGMWMYYTKVVPTSYTDVSGKVLRTNQFSVTQHYRKLLHDQPAQGHVGLPGVFIFYELSAIRVHVREHRPSLLHFVSRLCAIVAGVFTLAGMLDKFVYHGVKRLEKKLQVGKLS